MEISSPTFEDAGRIPSKYTCDGANVNPPLVFAAVPDHVVSLALVMDDPDAPSGTFVHWTLWDMDPSTGGIEENSLPASAVQGSNTARRTGYHGPCPPSGAHRYFFKLYALDAMLSVSEGASFAELEAAMDPHVVEICEFHGLYDRSW